MRLDGAGPMTKLTENGFPPLWLGSHKVAEGPVAENDDDGESQDIAHSEPVPQAEGGPVARTMFQHTHQEEETLLSGLGNSVKHFMMNYG